MKPSIRLGVNIDHVATLRQQRGTRYPDPVYAAQIAELAGADGITVHLREDRRHIQDRDMQILKEVLQIPLNFEMAVTPFMLDFAEKLKPEFVCFVPEKREELTTEGGLDVIGQGKAVQAACEQMAAAGIPVSLFIDPDERQIEAAKFAGAPIVEIHTGAYADAHHPEVEEPAFQRIATAAKFADELGLIVNGGHGLHYHNVQRIAAIPMMHELNIGHAIVARAIFSGFSAAVSEMKRLMMTARGVHYGT